MGADEQVRQYSCSAAAPGAVAPKRVAGEKQRGPRYLDQINPDIGEDPVSFLYSRVADRELGIYHGINQHAAADRCGVQLLYGPAGHF
jgi:hypothetical protein